jgi:hypothetical protein
MTAPVQPAQELELIEEIEAWLHNKKADMGVYSESLLYRARDALLAHEQQRCTCGTLSMEQPFHYSDCPMHSTNEQQRSQAAELEPIMLPPFEHHLVKAIYDILCDDIEPPNGEHWEGFAARRIVQLIENVPDGPSQAAVDDGPTPTLRGKGMATLVLMQAHLDQQSPHLFEMDREQVDGVLMLWHESQAAAMPSAIPVEASHEATGGPAADPPRDDLVERLRNHVHGGYESIAKEAADRISHLDGLASDQDAVIRLLQSRIERDAQDRKFTDV